MNNNNTSSPSPSQVSSCTFSFPNSPASSSSSSTTTTPKSNPSTPTTPNRLLNHFPPSQPRSLIEIHLKNNAFSSVVSQKSSTALKTTTTPPPNSTHASCTKTSFIMNNRTLTTTTTTTGIKKVTQSDHPSRKSCTSTTSKVSNKQHPVSPSHHSQPLPASIHSFTLPPCVYTDSTTTTIVANTTTSCTDKNMFLHHHQVAPTTSSISTCTIQTHNLNNTMFSQATLVPSSFSNPASLWMKSESGGSSSPLKVPSPSRIHSNYIYSPFTYNFIKQNTPSRNNAKPKNAQQKSKSNETDDGEKQAIERLEAFYLKKSELLASHLLSKMDHFYRSLLSCIQDILLRLMDTSRTTQCDETVMKKLDRIQRMINLKKYISSRIKEFDEWPMFFDSCITQVSAEDLSRLEDIERCTNNFKVIITGKEELTKNLNLASLKTRLTDHQMFQYVTQFIATCCWVDRKAIPEDVMNCLKFFTTIPTSDQVDLLKLAKKQDDHWTNRYDTPTLCSLQDLADSDDDVPMRDCTNAFSFTLM
ncbi:hypothetical protein C9374_000968 [Naegleria lovaniensis]|uniref:Uncharacterized protein n=1 Tax=Naegleria lovaniensis TaxID=51637 RepID=A0AA88KN16_NAELO|nr:uncharacterized protein C9374_000968 [Naegleria lovaniensis]KAG2388118.1 hypothetical protein C9374_000968 [Naegleria lovaniensis]